MEIQWTIGLELQLMNQNNKIIPPELISLYFLYGFFSVLELGRFFFFDFIFYRPIYNKISYDKKQFRYALHRDMYHQFIRIFFMVMRD